MKLSYLILPVMLLTGYSSYAQNAFPPTGPVGIGTNSAHYPLDVQHAGTGEAGAIVGLQGFVNAPGVGAYLRLIKSRGATTGTFSPTLAGDGLGAVDFMGVRTDNAIGYAARIVGYQDGTAGLSYIPGKLSFFTGSTANAMSERMTITSSGNIGIGTSTPTDLLHVNGAITVQDFGFVSSKRGDFNNYTNLFLGGGIKDNGDGSYTVKSDGASNYFGAIRIDNGISNNNAGAINFYDGISVSGSNYNITNANLQNSLRMTISGNGNVGIGMAFPQNKLDVNGTIHSREVKIDLSGWSDYVFKKDYQLPSLQGVKNYIDQHQHLPEIPSEQQIVKNGLNLGEMNRLLIKKMEEMTLYMIEAKEEINDLKKEVQNLKKRIK